MGLWIKTPDGTLEKAAGADGYYLPLTGGTLTGDLQVDGQIKAQDNGTPSNPGILFGGDGSGVYGADDFVGFTQGGTWRLSVTSDLVRIKPTLQVDGTLKMGANLLLYRNGDIGYRGRINGASMFDFYEKDHQNRIYRNLRVEAHGGEAGDLQVDGTIALPNARTDDVDVTAAPNLYLTANGNVRYTTFNAAPKAFNIAEDIDTADVLDRAETATMPVLDDDGVATADAEVESLTVNEVVTALLAKVKELSARIDELEGQTRL